MDPNQTTVRGVINVDLPGPRISRHLYGHFAEHLGRCIYDGFFVGEDSPIPNERGIRLDVVEALRAIGIPNLRWPGGLSADEYHDAESLPIRLRSPAPTREEVTTFSASASRKDGRLLLSLSNRITGSRLLATLPPHSFVTVDVHCAELP